MFSSIIILFEKYKYSLLVIDFIYNLLSFSSNISYIDFYIMSII